MKESKRKKTQVYIEKSKIRRINSYIKSMKKKKMKFKLKEGTEKKNGVEFSFLLSCLSPCRPLFNLTFILLAGERKGVSMPSMSSFDKGSSTPQLW